MSVFLNMIYVKKNNLASFDKPRTNLRDVVGEGGGADFNIHVDSAYNTKDSFPVFGLRLSNRLPDSGACMDVNVPRTGMKSC